MDFPLLVLKDKFALKLTQDHVKRSLEKQLADRFRNWRCDMHKHLKKLETVEEDKRHTYESVSNHEDWDYLCDLFSSEKYKVKFVIDNYSLMFLTKYFATYIYIIF